ncbi:MAG: peptidase T [Rikenellaceae bacterium]
MKERVLERFIRYIGYDTTSNPKSKSYPSTPSQREFMELLAQELQQIGCSEVTVDKYSYLTATVQATSGSEDAEVIGLFAHVDTSPEMSGKNIEVQIISDYNPNKAVRLGTTEHYLRSEDFPELSYFKGHTLLTTRGETLLGADDKAGVAEIITAMEYLINHSEIPHGKIRLCFTPDEEIGSGVDYFDVQGFGAHYAYTIDSGGEGCLEYENFNAASAVVTATGRNVHPGYAKGKMINALQTITALHSELPHGERPENTADREGFFHLLEMSGSVESATAEYIIRDHSAVRFSERKALMEALAAKYGARLELKDQYYNMREVVEPRYEIVQRVISAIQRAGAEPLIMPIRGGTDGARLSFMGLPCPNIFTGGMNPHSRFEYASLESMERAVWTIIYLCEL